ncbi:MAG: response regulator [Dehalococcoidales bacterium]|nr:response regulator [Dehalococcoidales bacterium]
MKPILVVDDEIAIRESIKDWLTDSGYEVRTAGSGELALEAIDEQDFEVAILDLKLPGKSGLEVFKEARTKNPKLNGIFITAYPSIDTAVEAMKEGAMDYLAKPFDMSELEKLIREKIGPLQIEIRKEKDKTAMAQEIVEEPPQKIEELIAIEVQDIPEHIKLGQDFLSNNRYEEAVKEFSSILKVAPESIEARTGLRKTQESTVKARTVTDEAALDNRGTKIKECLWMKMGMVDFNICTNEYNCINCDFDQMMQQKMARGESTELGVALDKLKELPGGQRLCRYAIKGDVSHRICSRLFQCNSCEFGQGMEDALQQKLAKLATRREALARKDAKEKSVTR